MARFTAARKPFGLRGAAESDEDAGLFAEEELPAPLRVKASARRVLSLKEAAGITASIPGPGESLHVLCTARMDLTDVVDRLIDALGSVGSVRVATLGFNARSLKAMTGWLDSGSVGTLCLLASKFFRSYAAALWEQTVEEFRARKQPCACCYSHAKVMTLAFASGRRLSIEGSANLCGNGSGREQFSMTDDAGLHDWHAAWIADMVRREGGGDAAPH